MNSFSVASDTAELQTEQRNPLTMDLDVLGPDELVRVLHRENYAVAQAVEAALPEVAKAVEIIAERVERGGRLIYTGAGTSGRLGVLDASECPPTFGVDPDLVQGLMAGGECAIRSSIEGAEDDPEEGASDLRRISVTKLDVVVGIAASGRTPYVIGALRAARGAGAYAIAVVNVRPSKLETVADLTIAAVTGPEALTGSTRLKAGTAQKMILNLLSTGAMIRLGKVYGNLMVDVRATNEKLRDRAIRIVTAATGRDPIEARAALEQFGWHAKTAIVSLQSGSSPQEAVRRLESARGRVREALAPNGDGSRDETSDAKGT